MQLTIEGLKPMYETLADAIDAAGGDTETAYGALNEMARMILCSTTTYEGLPIMEVIMNIEEDLKFVSGDMFPEEMEERIKFHYDLIKQRDEELKEFAKLKNNE